MANKAQPKQANSLRSQMEETYIPDRDDLVVSPRAYNMETYNYFKRYLIMEAISVLKFGFPDFWSYDQKRHFKYTLFPDGYTTFTNVPEFGVVALEAMPGGSSDGMLNLFWTPKEMVFSNPALPVDFKRNRKVGTECVIVRLEPDVLYWGPSIGRIPSIGGTEGIVDIVDRFATDMALAVQDLDANLINSQLAYAFRTAGKAMAETSKSVYTQIASGNPAVFLDEDMYDDQGRPLWDTFQQNLKQNYIANDVLQTLETLNDQYCTKIGIPNSNARKESGISEAETNANNVETQALSDVWVESLREGFDEVERVYGVKLTVEKRYKQSTGIVEKGDDENDDVRNN